MTTDLITAAESLVELAKAISEKEGYVVAQLAALDELKASLADDYRRFDEALDAVRTDAGPVQLRPTMAGVDAAKNGTKPAPPPRR